MHESKYIMKIDLIDRSFHPDLSSSREQPNTPIQWDRQCQQNGPIVISDLCLDFIRFYKKRDKKIAWIIEPEAISPRVYQQAIETYINNFDFVLTNHRKYCDGNKILYYFFGGTWIKEDQRKIYTKSKDLSITASSKNWTEGHALRHEAVAKFKDKMDTFGTGYNFVPEKVDALKDYRFQIVMENSREEGYVTEKLIDCFLTGTVPIYWGSTDSHLKEHFNIDGMRLFENMASLSEIVDDVIDGGETIYEALSGEIEENFEKAKNYVSAEHWIWNNLKDQIFV